MKKSLIALLLSGAVFWGFSLMGFTVTGGHGQGDAVIVLPSDCAASTRLAACELIEYVRKISGVELQTVSHCPEGRSRIIIGTADILKNLPEEIADKMNSTDNQEAFCILCRGNSLYIVGKKRVAELFGLYTFLEEKLGVRWFLPPSEGDDGEYVPSLKKIILPDFFMFQAPCFSVRRLDQVASHPDPEPLAGKQWAARRKFQISSAYGLINSRRPEYVEFWKERTPDFTHIAGEHTSFSQAVPRNLFASHPEYFSYVDGERRLTGKNNWQVCLSNAGVHRLFLNHIDRLYRDYGRNFFTFVMGLPDTSAGWCECAECRKYDSGREGDWSFRFHKVSSELVKGIFRRHPYARVWIWAYSNYRKFPAGVHYDPRVAVYYCIHGRCYGHRLDDPGCQRNVSQLSMLKQWRQHYSDIYIYEYAANTPLYYVPLEVTLGSDLALYRKMGIRGWKSEAYFPDSKWYPPRKHECRQDIFMSNWQWLYAASRLLWNPDLSIEAILQDAESKYYEAAYPAMRRYHQLRRTLWQNAVQCMGYPTDDQRRPHLLDVPGSREALEACLQEAERLAADNCKVMVRLGRDRAYLERYWIKANREARQKKKRVHYIPLAWNQVDVDGEENESDWKERAYEISDFKAIAPDGNGVRKGLPETLRTSVRLLTDRKYLYFLVEAREPQTGQMRLGGKNDGDLWNYDSIEILLLPPNASRNYYHVIVAPDGAVYDSVYPGKNTHVSLEIMSKCRIYPDRYVMEIRIPISKLNEDFRKGEIWKMHFGRNRTIDNDGRFGRSTCFSLNGCPNHVTDDYAGFIMGESPLLKNASLREVREGKLIAWNMVNGTLERTEDGFQAHLGQGGYIYQLLTHSELFQPAVSRKIKVTVEVSGKGFIIPRFLHYSDQKNKVLLNGRRRFFKNSVALESLKVSPDVRKVEFHYTIPAGEWCALMIISGGDIHLNNFSLALEAQ